MDNEMEDESNEFEKQEEELEKEVTKKSKEQPVESNERYTAIYQEPVVGILDTVTKKIVMQRILDLDASKDIDEATFRAMLLNKLGRIEVVTGA